jgi:c-di-GMP-binding flagellar brake protein YcgR
MSFFKQKRHQTRKSLMYYLEVIDINSGETIGRLVDITTAGIQIVGEKQLDTHTSYRLKMLLPETLNDTDDILFSGRCLRSEKDPYSRYYYSGFQFEELDRCYTDTIELLISGYEF